MRALVAARCENAEECSDGNLCNGLELCVNDQCAPGAPLLCDDALFCNGAETCDPASGCVPGLPPTCGEGERCDEDSDQCVSPTIPTTSQWGVIVLAITLLAAAKVRFGLKK